MIKQRHNQKLPDTLFADITVIQGDSVDELTVWQTAAQTGVDSITGSPIYGTPIPIDWTGAIGTCSLTDTMGTVVGALVVTLDNVGNMRLTATSTAMALIPAGIYRFAVEVARSGSLLHTYMRGDFISL